MLIRQADSVRQAWERSTVRKLVDQMLALYENVKPCWERISEELVWRMLRLRLEIARFQDDLGDNPANAIHEGEDLLADTERILGAGDRWTLYARHNLAVAFTSRRVWTPTRLPSMRRTLRNVNGPSARTTVTRAAPAQPSHRLPCPGRLVTRSPCTRKTSRTVSRILATDDRDKCACASRNNLAIAYQDAGRVSDAIALHERECLLYGAEPWCRSPRCASSSARLRQCLIMLQAASAT